MGTKPVFFFLVVGADDECAALQMGFQQRVIPGSSGGIQVHTGLIQQNQLGIRKDRQCEPDPLLHSGREISEGFVPVFFQAGNPEDILGIHFIEEGLEAGVKLQALQQAEFPDQLLVGRTQADVAVHFFERQGLVLTNIGNLAVGSLQVAIDHLQEGGFSGSVCA